MKTKKITGTENTITMQQIQDRIDYLMVILNVDKEPDDCYYAWPKQNGIDEYDEEDIEEFRGLIRFKTEEIPWLALEKQDTLFVHQDYFGQHACEVAKELHNFSDDEWPFNEIDWEKAADALMQDYRPVELFGSTFLFENF
ncbi:MAG: hypothetical protein EOM21_15995 [Gammaproteobacteria bacterium]|nr:hypothetical protein [Gammaproteobacteria bacterium]